MTSTRVIRGFKVGTEKVINRSTELPASKKLIQDTGNFQDIGAKIVRTKSRKAITHLARSKGLRTSEGFAQQLVKEEGIKIKIGDKSLRDLLQIEVPEMRRQEYIKADGSTGVRDIPVLDSSGNPLLVKKNLTIPGSIEYFQKPMKEKLAELQQILRDQTKSSIEKSDMLAILIMSMMRSSPPPSDDESKHMFDFSDEIIMAEDPIAAGLPSDGLEEGKFASASYLRDNIDSVLLYLMKFAKSRGLTGGDILYGVAGNPLKIDEIRDNLFDASGNPRTVNLLTSRIQSSPFKSIEFKEIEPEEFVPLGLRTTSASVARLLNQLTEDQKENIDADEFNDKSEKDKERFLETILESVIEKQGEEIPAEVVRFLGSLNEEEQKAYHQMEELGLKQIPIKMGSRSLGIFNQIVRGAIPKGRVTKKINEALGLDFSKLTSIQERILLKLGNSNLIRSTTQVGKGHSFYPGVSFGYVIN